MTTKREQELEQRITQLELIVLRAAAPSLHLPEPTIIEAHAEPTPAKPKKTRTRRKPIAPPDIAPVVQLAAVEGGLSPLNAVLRDCKATRKAVEGVTPLCSLDDVLERAPLKASIGVKAENVRRAWATIFHFRLEDGGEGVDLEQAREDLKDFRSWARDPMFVRALNTDPQLAVCWFIDVLLASTGDDED